MALWGEFTDEPKRETRNTIRISNSDLKDEQMSPESFSMDVDPSRERPAAFNPKNDFTFESNDSSSQSSGTNLERSFSRHQDLLKSKIVSHIAGTNAFFRSQQKDETDLTKDEKKSIAVETLDKNPTLFLSRYGKFLKSEHLLYFEQYRGDYEVEFYLKEISKPKSNAVVKNRRYQAMQGLINKGSYFSMREMKQRNPLLFEHLVGKYLSKDERREVEDENELCSLSKLLMAHMDRDDVSSSRRKMQEAEDEAWNQRAEEEDDDEVESEVDDDERDGVEIDPEEKEMLREEFVSSMYASFLEGKDDEFDYEAVDQNTDYDNIEMKARDEEERYFDDDDDNDEDDE